MGSVLRRVDFSIVLLGLAGGLYGQSCPSVNFSLPPAIAVNTGGLGGGLVRKSDSTYTRNRYQLMPPYTRVESADNFAAAALACAGYARRPLHVLAGWSPGSDKQLGTTSNNPVTADLTGGGALSAVVIDQINVSNMVKVARFNPDYSTRDVIDYAVPTQPTSSLAADFNGDGKRDIAVTRVDGVSILINNGDGTFRPPANYGPGTAPSTATAQDLNGDGILDLAIVDRSSPAVSILLGNGDGTFRAGVTQSLPLPSSFVAAGDLNGDGRQDLIAVAGGILFLLRNSGDASFQPPLSVPLIDSVTAGVATGDFDKDGRLDIVVVDHDSATAQILFGAGDGTFPNTVRYLAGSVPDSVVVSDFDFDGNLDIVIGAGHPDALTPSFLSSGEISILFGNGNRTFYAPLAVTIPSNPTGLVSADFNADGRPDFAIPALFSGTVQVLLGQSGGGFQINSIVVQDFQGANIPMGGIVARDVNGDGRVDLVVAGASSNSVWTLLGNGNGTFQSATGSAVGNPANSLESGDLNGDGRPDLVLAAGSPYSSDAPGVVTLLLGNGNGTWQTPQAVAVGPDPVDARLADLNGDGRLDLVVVNFGGIDSSGNPSPRGGVSILLGNGNGSFQQPVAFEAGSNPTKVAIADVNGDQKLDLLVLTGDPAFVGLYRVAVLLGAGNGSFSAAAYFSTDFGPTGITVADFNGDGKSDLVITHCCGDTVTSYLLGNGNGSFQAEVFLAAPLSSAAALAGDFNGDGRVDVAITASNIATGMFTVLTNLGSTPGSGGGGNGPMLSISKTHSGNFVQGQSGRTYVITVANSGGSVTSGTVTVNDNLPAGLMLAQMSGTGWTCFAAACSRSDALAPGGTYPPITVTVNVADSAPLQVTNQASVSGGGAAAAQASDVTTIGSSGFAAPSPLSVTPASGSASGAYTFTFSDPRGYQDLGVLNVLINNFLDGRQACYLAYSRPANTLYLVEDGGGALLPGAVLSAAGSISNGQCSVSWGATAVTASGNVLSLTLNISFSFNFGGNKVIYMAARDVAENNSGWQPLGVVTVPGTLPTTTTSVTGMSPARGAGTAATTFTFTFSDTAGVAHLGVENILINNFLDGRHACYLAYARPGNVLYLLNDNGDALLTGQVLNTAGSLSNGQCTVSWGASPVAAIGNNLTLTLNLAFNAAFAGNRVFYLAARDINESNNTGWQSLGTWTVQ